MTTAAEMEVALAFGLRPDLSREDLQQIYRRLVRQHHPDISGDVGAREVMARINAAYDAILRQEGRPIDRPAKPTRRQGRPEDQARGPKPAAEPASTPQGPKAVLYPDADLQQQMERIVLVALDDWMEVKQGVPREVYLRRMASLTGLHRPCERPSLHLPYGASLTEEVLQLHFASAAARGSNIIVLPALRAAACDLAVIGDVRVVLRDLPEVETRLRLPANVARSYGFDIVQDEQDLPIDLLFDGIAEDAGAHLCLAAGARYRGMFR